MATIRGCSNRYYNNLFAGGTGLVGHSRSVIPTQAGGNVFLASAKPCKTETNGVVLATINSGLKLVEDKGAIYLEMTLPAMTPPAARTIITSKLLGVAKIPNLPFMNYDGTPLTIDRDYFGNPRDAKAPTVGPFANSGEGKLRLKVWPK